MKVIQKLFLCLVFLVLPLHVYADGPGWTVSSTVEQLVVVATGGVNVLLSPSLNNCVSQSGYGQHHASIKPDHPGLKIMQGNLLTALTTGKRVRLYLIDSDCTAVEMMLDK